MRSELTGLFQLQNVDKELEALEALKGDLPNQVDKLKTRLDDTQASLQQEQKTLTETKTARGLKESELNSLQDKLNKSREQLYAVTSNREYDAITLEIDAITEKIDALENEILELIDREEAAAGRIGELEPQVTALEEDLNQKNNELRTKVAETEEEYNRFMKERERIASNIQKSVLYQYERIRKGLGNSAVAEIKQYACGGCFSSIPPQKSVEIKMMKRLIHCESCGRILVYVEEEQPVTH